MIEKIGMTKIQIRGPAVDVLEERKESDNGPAEAQVTREAAAHFKRFGPPQWSKELLEKIYNMGRPRS